MKYKSKRAFIMNLNNKLFILSLFLFISPLVYSDDFKIETVDKSFWTRPYLGFTLGQNHSDARSTETDDNLSYNGEDIGTYESNGGGIVSLRTGKNWFVGQDKILLGVELAAGYMDVDDSKQLESLIGLRTPDDSVAKTRGGNFLQFSGKAGFLVNSNLLTYVKAGYVTSDITQSLNDTDPIGATITDTRTSKHDGYLLGLGMEYALSKNLSLGLEYTRYDFGDEKQTSPDASGYLYTFKHELDVDSLSVGLNYYL